MTAADTSAIRDILIEWQAARAPFLKLDNKTTPADWTRLSKAEYALSQWADARYPPLADVVVLR